MSFIVHRVAKSAARYTDAGGREKCAYCRFFVAPRACGKVIGPVSPMGWCKYFSRQMVSQFGGSIVTSGIPAGATLALDFMSSGNMPPGITFSRASTATYTDASGLIQTAAVNQPRWEARGLLIEEARTNIALWSTDFNNAVWSLFNGAAKGATVTGPNGTSTGMTLNFTNAATDNQLYQSASVPTGMTFSIYARAGTLSRFLVRFSATGDSPVLNLTSQWQRFSFTCTADSGNVAIKNFGTDTGSINIWGAQLEQGAFPTSYIPTTAASATRSEDIPAIPSANVASWFSATQGTWLAELIPFRVVSSGFQRIIFVPPISGNTMLGIDTTAHAFSYDVGPMNASANVMTVNAVTKAASSWAAATGKICLNGAAVVTTAGMANGFGTAVSAGIGLMRGGTAPESSYGYLRRITYWPRVLSDIEMQGVTT